MNLGLDLRERLEFLCLRVHCRYQYTSFTSRGEIVVVCGCPVAIVTCCVVSQLANATCTSQESPRDISCELPTFRSSAGDNKLSERAMRLCAPGCVRPPPCLAKSSPLVGRARHFLQWVPVHLRRGKNTGNVNSSGHSLGWPASEKIVYQQTPCASSLCLCACACVCVLSTCVCVQAYTHGRCVLFYDERMIRRALSFSILTHCRSSS